MWKYTTKAVTKAVIWKQNEILKEHLLSELLEYAALHVCEAFQT